MLSVTKPNWRYRHFRLTGEAKVKLEKADEAARARLVAVSAGIRAMMWAAQVNPHVNLQVTSLLRRGSSIVAFAATPEDIVVPPGLRKVTVQGKTAFKPFGNSFEARRWRKKLLDADLTYERDAAYLDLAKHCFGAGDTFSFHDGALGRFEFSAGFAAAPSFAIKHIKDAVEVDENGNDVQQEAA